MLTVAAAFLSGPFLGIFLCGVYTVLFLTVMYLFHRRHRIPGRKPARWVLLGLVLQFVTITAVRNYFRHFGAGIYRESVLQHCIDTIYRTCFSFLRLGGGPAADAFDIHLSTPSVVLKSMLFVICTLVTDLLVIHRVYVVFSYRHSVIMLPLTFLVGQAVCDGGVVYHLVKSYPGNHLRSLLNGWMTTAFVLSIIITRALNRVSERISGGMRITSVLAILVESTMLQTATTIAILVSFHLGSIGQYIILIIAPAVFGISTVLIHVRIGLGWVHACSGAHGN
ncbi:hypothetical protein C8R44DRAFT_864959 [Mycena epipterygia]|nr:hypothetical protein C8R44DRAFT_864959 [Mycena epipterygia]